MNQQRLVDVVVVVVAVFIIITTGDVVMISGLDERALVEA